MCLKTRENGGGKVFLNVCTSDTLPAPENITEEELIKILESDQPSDFRVPMSIGAPHTEKDKCEWKYLDCNQLRQMLAFIYALLYLGVHERWLQNSSARFI